MFPPVPKHWMQLKRFREASVIPAHHHASANLNLLLSGELIEISSEAGGQLRAYYRKAPCIWQVPGDTSHSLKVIKSSKLLSFSLPFTYTGPQTSRLPLVTALALTLSTAQACEFSHEDVEKLVQSDEQIEVPDCFFDNLAAAASGGDPQAQLDLGIVTVEGLDERRESSTSEGFYWIKRAMYAGHPTAEYILKGYEDELRC